MVSVRRNDVCFFRVAPNHRHINLEICKKFDRDRRIYSFEFLNAKKLRYSIMADPFVPPKDPDAPDSPRPRISKPRKTSSAGIQEITPSSLKGLYTSGLCWMCNFILNARVFPPLFLSSILLTSSTCSESFVDNSNIGWRAILVTPEWVFPSQQAIRFALYTTISQTHMVRDVDEDVLVDSPIPAYKYFDFRFVSPVYFTEAVKKLFYQLPYSETAYCRKFNRVLIFGNWSSDNSNPESLDESGYYTGLQYAYCKLPKKQIFCLPDTEGRKNSVDLIRSDDPADLIHSEYPLDDMDAPPYTEAPPEV